MKTMTHLALFLCLFQSLKITAQNTLSVSTLRLEKPLKDSIHLHNYISIFVDKKRSLSFQSVQRKNFTHIDSFVPDSKFNAGRPFYWYQFSVENTLSDTQTLSLNMPYYDTIIIYIVQNGQLLDTLTIGSKIKRHPQPQKTAYPSNRTALLYFPPQTTQYIFMRCNRLSYQFQFNPKLFDKESEAGYFIWALIPYYTWYAFFLGILIFVFLTSLFNYGQTRHKAFLYYAAYVFAHFFYFWYNFENNDQFFGVLPTWIFDYYYYTPIAWGWGIFYILFLTSFFETKTKMPQFHFLLKPCLAFLVLLLLIERILVSYDKWWAWEMNVWGRFILNFAGLFLLIYMLLKLKGNPLARYILIGNIGFAIGSFGTRFSSSTSAFWDNGLLWHQIGILFELLFFSMGLAYKFRLDAIDKERYYNENQRLELERALSLARLRNEISQDIHDEIGAGLTKIALGAQFMLRLPNITMFEIKEKIKSLESDTRNLAAHLREIVFAINPEYDDFDEMQAYFRDSAQLFWAETDMKLIFDFPKSETKFAVSPDKKRHLLLIFTEMQNNIAKHAQATQVSLTLKMSSRTHYKLSIEDNGIGFIPLSKNGVSKGLSGMKSRAKSINATFFMDSTEGKGTLISIDGRF